MAISVVMGALSTGMTALSGTAFLGGFLFGGVGTALSHFLVTTAMGAALGALSPKNSLTSGGYSYSTNYGSAVDHQIIYGRTKVGGVDVYASTTGENNKYLHRCIVFAGHTVEDFEEIYVDETKVTLDGSGNVTAPARYAGYLVIKKHLGATDQAADADLVAATSSLGTNSGLWTNQHTLSGLAYLYVKATFNTSKFPNGVPAITAVIKGKKVYDPRTDTTAWSDNAALCLRDYVVSEYGLNQPSSRVNNTDVSTAADICDEIVQGEKRYTCNGAFTTANTPKQVITDLVTTMGGVFWFSSGKWRMRAGSYVAPTQSFNEDDLRSGLSISTRYSRRDSFNTVKGTFIGETTNWQPVDYPTITSQDYVNVDNGNINTLDYSLPFSKTNKTAQRLAWLVLNRNREQLTFSATFSVKAMNCEIGEIIQFSNTRMGWVNKEFEVTSWTPQLTQDMALVVQMTLREISSDVFATTAAASFEANNTTLPNAYDEIPINLALTAEVRTIKEEAINVLVVEITSSNDESVEKIQLQYKLSSSTSWKNLGYTDVGTYEINNVDDGIYDVRARSFSYLGVAGSWQIVQNFQVSTTSGLPDDVTNFSYDVSGNNVSLTWDPVTSNDLSYYKIRHSYDQAGATWANSYDFVSKVARPATSVNVAAKPGTYLIKAVDKTGQMSNTAATIVFAESSMFPYINQLTSVQAPTFSGTKTGCVVTASTLRISPVAGTPPFSATYDFTTYIDIGSVKRFRARIDVDVDRFDTTGILVDDLTGNIDSLAPLWDDLTAGTNSDDVSVVTWISTTPDDPAVAPVWSAYIPFRSGQFYGRAARFRVTLSSKQKKITPAINLLTAVVDYN